MKKYITTEKHPIFRDGIEFAISDHGSYDMCNFAIHGTTQKFYKGLFDCNWELWLSLGYIKELQEPKFTEDDMWECWIAAENNAKKQSFDTWLKNRNKSDE